MLTKVAGDDFELDEAQHYAFLNAVADADKSEGPGTIELDFYRNQLDDLVVKFKDHDETIATIQKVAWRKAD